MHVFHLDKYIEGLNALLAYIRLGGVRHGVASQHSARTESSTPRNTFTITAAATSRLPTCARRDPPLYIIARKEHIKLCNSKTF